MSYYANVYPKDNLGEFKYSNDCTESLHDSKYAIIYNVLKKYDEKECKVESAIKELKYALKYRIFLLEEDEKHICYTRWKDEGELWWCGWKYANLSDKPEKESVLDYAFEKLFLMKTLVESGDYFSSDCESNFYKKLNEVIELLEYFDGEIRDIIRFDLIEKYGTDEKEENEDAVTGDGSISDEMETDGNN